MWYVAAFCGGFASAFGAIVGIGAYAIKKPEIMAPVARRMTRAMFSSQMKGGK